MFCKEMSTENPYKPPAYDPDAEFETEQPYDEEAEFYSEDERRYHFLLIALSVAGYDAQAEQLQALGEHLDEDEAAHMPAFEKFWCEALQLLSQRYALPEIFLRQHNAEVSRVLERFAIQYIINAAYERDSVLLIEKIEDFLNEAVNDYYPALETAKGELRYMEDYLLSVLDNLEDEDDDPLD